MSKLVDAAGRPVAPDDSLQRRIVLSAQPQPNGRSIVEVRLPAHTTSYVLCEMIYSLAHALVLEGLATPAQLEKVVNAATLAAVTAAPPSDA